MLIDIWEQCFRKFHHQPHLRHEMCLHVCRDTPFCQAARADPSKHLSRYCRYTAYIEMRHRRAFTDKMDAEKLVKLVKRAAAFFALKRYTASYTSCYRPTS
eukprot:142437-Pleurochrysis_carterae.AAC.1